MVIHQQAIKLVLLSVQWTGWPVCPAHLQLAPLILNLFVIVQMESNSALYLFIIGFIFDASGRYEYVYAFSGSMLILASGMTIIIPIIRAIKQRKSPSADTYVI